MMTVNVYFLSIRCCWHWLTVRMKHNANLAVFFLLGKLFTVLSLVLYLQYMVSCKLSVMDCTVQHSAAHTQPCATHRGTRVKTLKWLNPFFHFTLSSFSSSNFLDAGVDCVCVLVSACVLTSLRDATARWRGVSHMLSLALTRAPAENKKQNVALCSSC